MPFDQELLEAVKESSNDRTNEKNSISKVRYYLQQGANVNVRAGPGDPFRGPPCGYCPLDMASSGGNLNLVKLLVEHGAHINSRGNNANTPLHYAYTYVDVAQFLLDQGASLEAVNHLGETPLLMAARCGSPKVIKLLLERGANINVRDKEGKTPLELAYYWPERAEVLRQYINKIREDTQRREEAALREYERRTREKAELSKQEQTHALELPVTSLSISFSLSPEEVVTQQELGRGGFGIVYKGLCRHQEVAIKQLHTQLSKEALDEFKREAMIMAQLKSPNIVQLYGFVQQAPYRLVMEYLPKGDLYNVLHNPKEILSWEQRAQIALDIARGLAYLHKGNILHRDLKSKNVLLTDQLRAKLADFGLAKVKQETGMQSTGKIVGTLAWMAPELFKRRAVFTLKADIYSYGVTLWELSARQNPFVDAHGNQTLIKAWVSEGERDEIPQDTPKALANLIEVCWAQTPEHRPTTQEVIARLEAPEATAAQGVNTPIDLGEIGTHSLRL